MMENIEIKQVIASRAIIIKDNKILAVTSSEKEDIERLWHLPGGWLEPLELVKYGCEREVYEETGMEIKATKVIFAEESIVDHIDQFDNIVQKLDLFCIANIHNVPEDKWEDTDNGLIKDLHWFSEDEWKENKDILAPEPLKELNFSDILALPSCYHFRQTIDDKYLHIFDEKDKNKT